MQDPEFFGSDFQVSLQEKCLAAWPALQANPNINFSGRSFGWDDPTLDDIDAIAELTNRFGLIAAFAVPGTILQPFIESAKSRQLDVGVWQRFRSRPAARELCAAILENSPGPAYRLELLDQSTPAAVVREFQAVMQANGIAPLPGYILRGARLKCAAVMVRAGDDSIAATAVGVLRHHPQGPYANWAQVGYLATRPEHRRRGLAKAALAKVNQVMMDEFGVEQLHTGIRADNVASQKTCEACGLFFDGDTYLLAVQQPNVSGTGQFTR